MGGLCLYKFFRKGGVKGYGGIVIGRGFLEKGIVFRRSRVFLRSGGY